MPAFDRTSPWLGESFALNLFRERFTELNSQYWGGVPSEVFVRRLLGQHGLSADFTTALGVSGRKWKRVANDLAELEEKFKSHRRWSTLLTLVLLTSCLERFISTAAVAAVRSDPLLAPGFPKRVDGALLLKHGHSLPVDVSGLTVGTWSARIAAYQKLFKRVPAPLKASEGDLERIRVMRNRVAHQFGAIEELVTPERALQSVSLSESRLTKWLGLVDSVARAIDSHLRVDCIGDFEMIELFHYWRVDHQGVLRRTQISIEPRYSGDSRGFQKFIGGYTGRSTGAKYASGLNAFYSSL